MKTADPKKSMKTTSLWKNTLVFAALIAFLFPILSEAGQMRKPDPLVGKTVLSVTSRPLFDFLDAQGTLNDPPQFFPLVKDYSGWADGNFTTFGLVDYAGLADKYIKAQTGHSLGTTMEGNVIERRLVDGTAQITVVLSTKRALGFAQSIADLINSNFDFLNTPTIFGAKAQDVVTGKDAAVGPVTLLTTFSISAPGAALPDFLDVINNPAQYAPVKFDFTSTTVGMRPDGKKAILHVHQVGSTDAQKVLNFSIEKVEVVDAGGNN
jgi:hypothetical protein